MMCIWFWMTNRNRNLIYLTLGFKFERAGLKLHLNRLYPLQYTFKYKYFLLILQFISGSFGNSTTQKTFDTLTPTIFHFGIILRPSEGGRFPFPLKSHGVYLVSVPTLCLSGSYHTYNTLSLLLAWAMCLRTLLCIVCIL
jgi:hypothetical protein